MKNHIHSARNVIEIGLELQPLTPLGALLLLGGMAAVEFANTSLDLIVLVAGWSVLALLALSVAIVVLGAFWTRRGARSATASIKARFTANEPVHLPFSVPSLRFFPLLNVSWRWKSHPSVTCEQRTETWRTWAERVTFPERGRYADVVRLLSVRDALGLAKVSVRIRDPNAYLVLPERRTGEGIRAKLAVAGGADLHHPSGRPVGDRIDLRRYTPGDPARFIHWKIFGRTRKLVIRVPERAWMEHPRKLVFFVAGDSDEASASTLRSALEAHAFGEQWEFCASGMEHTVSTQEDALDALIESKQAAGWGAKRLGRVLAAVEKQGPTSVIVFAPPVFGEWLNDVQRVAQRRSGGVHVICAAETIHESPHAPWWKPLLLNDVTTHRVTRSGIEQIRERLASSGASLTVVGVVIGRAKETVRRAA